MKMGIHGFTSFMNNKYIDRVLEDVNLRNTFLVIDTNSLIHKLHACNNLQPFYSGNYDKLASKLNDLCIIFKKCHIEPIFMLDGGCDPHDLKFQTKLNRTKERIRNACSSFDTPQGNNSSKKINIQRLIDAGKYPILNGLLPINAFTIFIDVIEHHKFKFFQCLFEADYEIAYLANHLKCPVLSQDSDFMVYDLAYGYIPSEFIELNIEKLKNELNDRIEHDLMTNLSASYYLPVRVYKLQGFLDVFNAAYKKSKLVKEMLPIFAVLVGNDYVDSQIFVSLKNAFNPSNNNFKDKRVRGLNTGKRKRQYYDKVLEWLGKHNTIEDCIQQILHLTKSENHDLIKKVIDENTDEYLMLKPSMTSYFNAKISNEPSSMEPSLKQVTTYAGKNLTDQFLLKFSTHEINRFSIDVLVHRRVIFAAQIEVIDWPSSYMSSQHIRKVFYSILINNYEADDTENVVIKEYLRYKNSIKVYSLDLRDRAKYSDTGSLNAEFVFKNLLGLSGGQCKRLGEFNGLSNHLRNLFAVAEFWLKFKESSKDLELSSANCKRALIVSLIKSSIVDVCYKNFSADFEENEIHQSNTKSTETSLKVIENTAAHVFLKNPDYLADNDFASDINDYILSDRTNNDYIKEVRAKLSAFNPSFSLNHSQMKKSSSHKLGTMFNLKLIHLLCEFQAIYLSLNYMQNSLKVLDVQTIQLPELSSFFNGTFLHNFIDELGGRKYPDLYIEELFGRKSLLRHVYKRIIGSVEEILAPDYQVDEDLNSKFNKITI